MKLFMSWHLIKETRHGYKFAYFVDNNNLTRVYSHAGGSARLYLSTAVLSNATSGVMLTMTILMLMFKYEHANIC